MEKRRLGMRIVGGVGSPARVAAPLMASSRPPNSSTMRLAWAWAPEKIRPSAIVVTAGRSSLRPSATAAMNWPWTSSSKAWSTRRSSGVMGRAMLPMSLNWPAFTTTQSTPTFLKRLSRLASCMMTPIEPVSVPGLA